MYTKTNFVNYSQKYAKYCQLVAEKSYFVNGSHKGLISAKEWDKKYKFCQTIVGIKL